MEAEWSAEVGAADYAVFRSVLDRLSRPSDRRRPTTALSREPT